MNTVEHDLARRLGRNYAVLINNDAVLELLAFMCLSNSVFGSRTLTNQDEVVLAATASPQWIQICKSFSRPVLTDISIFTLSPTNLMWAEALTENTKLIVLPNTLGYLQNQDSIRELKEQNHLWVIEDLTHAVNSTVDGGLAGDNGDISIVSLGQDGGVLLTDSSMIYQVLNELVALFKLEATEETLLGARGWGATMDYRISKCNQLWEYFWRENEDGFFLCPPVGMNMVANHNNLVLLPIGGQLEGLAQFLISSGVEGVSTWGNGLPDYCDLVGFPKSARVFSNSVIIDLEPQNYKSLDIINSLISQYKEQHG